MAHWDIVVTHSRGEWRTSGPRKAVRPFTLTNMPGTEEEATALLHRCEREHPQYKLRLEKRP